MRRIYCDHTDASWNGCDGLLDLVKRFCTKMFVVGEIGSFAGVSTKVFAANVKLVYAIDPWQPYLSHEQSDNLDCFAEVPEEIIFTAEKRFDHMLKTVSNIIKIKSFSNEACKMFQDGFFDLIYLDANHSYEDAIEDIRIWTPKIKKSGILSGHDYYNKNIKAALTHYNINNPYVFSDTSWAIEKKNYSINEH